jgi:hypothetical protein
VPVDFDHCHIPLESSPGWPYTYWCGSKVQFYEKFGDLVDLYHEKVRMGIRPFIVWSVFIKTELLKRRKLDTDDGRTIICPPAEFLTVGKMYTQDFNERIISAWKGIPVKLGFVKYFGEFHEFAKKMDRFPNKLEGDATKWDSTLDSVDVKILKDFRKDTISPAYKTKEVFNCLDVIYLENSQTRMLMPNNVVTQKDGGMPSGSPITSTDNSLSGDRGAREDWANLVSIPLAYEGEIGPTFDDWFEHMIENWERAQAGDDELESYSDNVAHLYFKDAVCAQRSSRKLIYTAEKCKSSRDLEGLKFLGSTFHYHPYYHKWVPVFDGDKAIHSLLEPESKTSIHVDLYRCLALRAESYWHESARARLTGVRDYLVSKGGEPRPTKKSIPFTDDILGILLSPNDAALISLYLGMESTNSSQIWLDTIQEVLH